MRLNQSGDSVSPFGDKKKIAENLYILLKQHNLTANLLAQKLGIPKMTVRRLLSGETEDPRISTLKMIADYFNISIDLLINENQKNRLVPSKKARSYLIPKFTWETLLKFHTAKENTLHDWNEWQSISLNEHDSVSKKTFALESRPSMYPRFPKGTLFIIDPDAKPTDGDIVLIRFKENNEFTLRELVVDPPHYKLISLVADSETIHFSELHEIVGVSLITMLYNPKING